MKIKNILFDLDGTLTDPKPGITKSIQYALEKLGRAVPDAEELTWCIGPPLLDSFRKILGEDKAALAEEALAFYRERFADVGKFENEVYPDIPEVLGKLGDQGLNLFVATSKPYVFAKDIVDHFGLAGYFTGIYGSKLNGELCEKADLIHHVVEREHLNRNATLMAGDRKHDILGAKSCHIRSLGLTYGYGTRDELVESGADFLADSPWEILELIKRFTS